MKKFEYLTFSVNSRDKENKDKIPLKLNELGSQGWECFFSTQGPDLSHPQMHDFHTFYFKRPAPESAPAPVPPHAPIIPTKA